jgi:hypothetical protein
VSDGFVEQLKQLCVDYPVDNKWVVVPTQDLRWTLGERLLGEGHNWINLRFVTPFQMALDERAPWLLEQGLNPCPETLGPSLLASLLMSSSKKSEPYFLPLILQPGMADALWKTLQEFRMAGLSASDLQRLEGTPKNLELMGLFQSYQDYLAAEQLVDRPGLFQSQGQESAIAGEDQLVVYPYHHWSRLEQQWIDSLPAKPRSTEPAEHKDANDSASPSQSPRSVRAVWVSKAQPYYKVAHRRIDEIDQIARTILQPGDFSPADSAEIAAASEDYPLIRDRMASWGLSCTFERGLPILTTRPGQAIEGLLNWLEKGLPAAELRELLNAQLLCAEPSSFKAVRLLESAQVSWGREPYLSQLQAISLRLSDPSLERDPAELAAQQQDIQTLKEWLANLFKRFPPANKANQVSVGRWLTGLQQTLAKDFSVRGPEEESARRTIDQALEELKLLPGQDGLSPANWPLDRLLVAIRHRLQSLRGLASRPRPGAVHVTTPEQLGLSGRRNCFWIGMEEGKLFPSAIEDCILSDQERLQLGLLTSEQRRAQQAQQIDLRLSSISGQLTLSYAVRDMEGDQEQMPAWLFFESVRRDHPEIDSYQKLAQFLGPALGDQATPLEGAHSPRAQRWRERGAIASGARKALEFGPFDGYVAEAAGRWDPRVTGTPMSVSRLTSLATCPFQFFLETGLGLRKKPLELPDPDSWLDPATRGTVLHEVYAAYHRELRARNWRPDPERDGRQLQSLLKQQLDKVRESLPPLSEAIEKSETASLKKDLEHFLQLELQSPERRPVALEIPFGMGVDELEPLAHPEPVKLELSDGSLLPLRGRIDRIDQIGESYAVIDYKTGRKLYTGSRNATYDRGRLLQHAVYALVAEKILQAPGQVIRSSYYFTTRAAARNWTDHGYPNLPDLQRVLEAVLEPLKTGAFIHSHQQEGDCKFCDFRAACEAHLDWPVKAKLEHLGNVLLESRRALLEEK